MSKKVNPIPEGCHTVTPYLTVNGAAQALEFYKKAFNAHLLTLHDLPDGKVVYAQLKIGDSMIMVSDEFPGSACGMAAPSTLKGTTVAIHLYVEDVDKLFKQALQAGATEKMPVSDTFWGARYGQLVDPFGHIWSLATQTEILSDSEVKTRAQELFAGKH